MGFRLGVLGFLVLACVSGVGATLVDHEGWKVNLGGFAEMDTFLDSTRSLTEVPGNGAIDRPGGYNGDNGRLQLSGRNSRLNFMVMAPAEEGWRGRGLVEADFLGFDPAPGNAAGGTESSFYNNPTLRLRHAYVAAENGPWQILVGQYWSLLGWQTAYLLTTVSVPPVAGVVFQRTPQILVMNTTRYGEIGIESAFALSRPPQRDSNLPSVDAGVRFSIDDWKGAYVNAPTGDDGTKPFGLAITGTARDFAINAANGSFSGQTHYLGYAAAIDGMIPILSAQKGDLSNSLVLSGEFSIGRGYADLFPGWSGNLNAMTASGNTADSAALTNLDPGFGGLDGNGFFHLADLQSVNINLQYHAPAEWHLWFNVGYAKLFSDNIASFNLSTPQFVANGRVAYQQAEVYFFNLFHDVTKSIRLGAEFSYGATTYVDAVVAHNDRYQVSAWYRF